MITGNKFTYNGKSSDLYGLRFLIMDTEPNKEIGGILEYATFKNNKSPYITIQDVNYNSTFEIEVEMISEHKLDEKLDEIYMWILNQANFKKLYIDNNDGFYFNCYFTSASFIDGYTNEGYGIYGIKSTMVCDSTFMWKDVSFAYNKLSDTITHENISDVREYTYPTLKIKTGNVGGNITIQNISDNNRLLNISNTLSNDTITISYMPMVINSYLNNNKQLVYDSFNKNFFRLLQGTNNIGVVGDVTEITLDYKIGRLVR